MDDPKRLYECLLDYCSSSLRIEKACIGLVWTVCQTSFSEQPVSGLAMSPAVATRTLPWPGTLKGRTLKEVGQWLTEWEPYQASMAMAAINCSINSIARPPEGLVLPAQSSAANLTVFHHFLPQLHGKKVVVIGHYPGIEVFVDEYQWQVLERAPSAGDFPDPAAEFLLPDADWVFLSASTIPNKTFPRLAELSADATTVLMGPTVPWLPQLSEFGIDYLAGVDVVDAEQLYQTASEGGGVRIFDEAVRYRIVALFEESALAWLKQDIAATFADRERLTLAMEQWYGEGHRTRFPQYTALDDATARLSRLDTAYKRLWDAQQA